MSVSNRTMMILKPDCVWRRLVGPVLNHILDAGFVITRLEHYAAPSEGRALPSILAAHYMRHADAPYFERLVRFMASGPIYVAILHKEGGDCSVSGLRTLMGGYKHPRDPHTIRGRFMRNTDKPYENLIHGSDSPEEAEREIELWFPGD